LEYAPGVKDPMRIRRSSPPRARRRRVSALPITGDLEQLRAAALTGELPDARGRFGPFGAAYVPGRWCRRSSG
jgi:hypothetical protein